MKILIIGGNGTIGKRVKERFKQTMNSLWPGNIQAT
jgi:nucleoside-diphosphate-sugar epimerase